MADQAITSWIRTLLSGQQTLFEFNERCTGYISHRRLTALLVYAGGWSCRGIMRGNMSSFNIQGSYTRYGDTVN